MESVHLADADSLRIEAAQGYKDMYEQNTHQTPYARQLLRMHVLGVSGTVRRTICVDGCMHSAYTATCTVLPVSSTLIQPRRDAAEAQANSNLASLSLAC